MPSVREFCRSVANACHIRKSEAILVGPSYPSNMNDVGTSIASAMDEWLAYCERTDPRRQYKAKRIAPTRTRAQIADEEFGCFEAMAISRSPSLASSGGSSPNMSAASPTTTSSKSPNVCLQQNTIFGRRKWRIFERKSTGTSAAPMSSTPSRSAPPSSASSSDTSLTSCLSRSSRSSLSTASTSATTPSGSPTSSSKRKSVRFRDLGASDDEENRLEPISFLKNPPTMGPIQLGRVVDTPGIPSTPAWFTSSPSGPDSAQSLPVPAQTTTPMPTFEVCVVRNTCTEHTICSARSRSTFVSAQALGTATSPTKDDGTVSIVRRTQTPRSIYGPREVIFNLAEDGARADAATTSNDRLSPSTVDTSDNNDTVVIQGIRGIEVQRLYASLAYRDDWAEHIVELVTLHRGDEPYERVAKRLSHVAALLKQRCVYVDFEYSPKGQTWNVVVSRLDSSARNPHMDRGEGAGPRSGFDIKNMYSGIYAARSAGLPEKCAPFCAWA